MIGRARSVAVVGLRAVDVAVEAHVGAGLPGFAIIGSSGSAAREAAHRVRTALACLGVSLPNRKVLVSLAPADVPKVGARFDLAMGLAILAALGAVGERALDGTVLLGELGLDGSVRPVPAVLPAASSVRGAASRVVVARENAREAALVEGLAVVGVATLEEAVEVARGDRPARPLPDATPATPPSGPPDLADVAGQPEARRALEVAAAGGHHVLLLGPPGCGKSMLARRLPSILPPLSDRQALEVAAIRSVAGRYTGADGGPLLLDHVPPLPGPAPRRDGRRAARRRHRGRTARRGVARPPGNPVR